MIAHLGSVLNVPGDSKKMICIIHPSLFDFLTTSTRCSDLRFTVNPEVYVWNILSGSCLRKFNGHTEDVSSVVWSLDGTQIASRSYDTTIRLWDVAGVLSMTLEGHSDSVLSVASSPDGVRILSATGDCTIRIWDASTGIHLTKLSKNLSGLRFSPDATLPQS
jgi:WD40 repeat protein